MLQFIAGERRHGTSENVVSVIEPATGEVITTGYCASEKDVDEAVAAVAYVETGQKTGNVVLRVGDPSGAPAASR